MTEALRVLHVIGSFYPSPQPGGLQRAVLQLGRGLQNAGVDVEVATTSTDRAGRGEVDGIPVRYFARVPSSGYFASLQLATFLRRSANDYDLLHATGLFTFPTALTSRIGEQRRVPYVVTPSGMCRPWAMRYRSWKKRPYWWALERHHLEGASALHATSEPEAEELRALFPRGSVFMVPNAVPPQATSELPRHPERVVFLGRIHPIKGLELLIDAMSELSRRRPEVELVVAGPDDVGHWRSLQARIARCTPRPRVRYVGVVDGEAKHELLATASALALTSHSESFGLVVVEALAVGTPVVTTRGCPWSQVEVSGAGRWVRPEPEQVARGLDQVLDAGEPMRRAARALSTRFTPEEVGAAMAKRYAEVIATPTRGAP